MLRLRNFFKKKLRNIWCCINRVPTWTKKAGNMGRHFIVGEKSGNFEQTGKIRQNYTKYWKTPGISHKFYLLFVI